MKKFKRYYFEIDNQLGAFELTTVSEKRLSNSQPLFLPYNLVVHHIAERIIPVNWHSTLSQLSSVL